MQGKLIKGAVLAAPFVLIGIAIVFAPGLDAKILTAFGFATGTFAGAAGITVRNQRRG